MKGTLDPDVVAGRGLEGTLDPNVVAGRGLEGTSIGRIGRDVDKKGWIRTLLMKGSDPDGDWIWMGI